MNILRTGLHFASSGSWIGPPPISWSGCTHTTRRSLGNEPATQSEEFEFSWEQNRRNENAIRKLHYNYVHDLLRQGLPQDEFTKGFNRLCKLGASYEHLEVYSEAATRLLEENISIDILIRSSIEELKLNHYPLLMKVFLQIHVEDALKGKERKIKEERLAEKAKRERQEGVKHIIQMFLSLLGATISFIAHFLK